MWPDLPAGSYDSAESMMLEVPVVGEGAMGAQGILVDQ